MKRGVAIVLVFCLLCFLVGCASTDSSTAKSTAWGAMLGAAAGAAIGYLESGDTKGTLVGAGIGAVAGGITGFTVGKYRERQCKQKKKPYTIPPTRTKTRKSSQSSAPQLPVVKNIRPYVEGPNGRKGKVVKGGEQVFLGAKYDLVVPSGKTQKIFKVTECNTLINQKNEEMSRSKLTRPNRARTAGTHDGAIAVMLPENLPDGKYTHVAILKVGDKEYTSKQRIQIARASGGTMYAQVLSEEVSGSEG